MGIRLKFIFLLIACFTIPCIAIFTNLEDWLNNRQDLELYKERQRYHQLGKSFEKLFTLYLDGIHLLSVDCIKGLDKIDERQTRKGRSFSRVNSEPSFWTNGFSFNGRFYEREFKTWSPARRANFLGKNIGLKSLLHKTVIKKLLSPSDESEWEAASPSIIQVFALEKNLLDGKVHTAQNLQSSNQEKLSKKFKDLRIQPLIHYGSESSQWLWDQLIGIIQNLYEFISQPDKISSARMKQLMKYFGDSLPNSRGQRFPISIEGLEFEISWNTIPSNFGLHDFISGNSEEEIPDCIAVSIIFMQKARNRFLETWLNSDLDKVFSRLDTLNRTGWKSHLKNFKSQLDSIEKDCKVVFFDPLGIQTFDTNKPLTTRKERLKIKLLNPQHIDHIYNDKGGFGVKIDASYKSKLDLKGPILLLHELAHSSEQNIDFRGKFDSESVIGSMVSMQQLPSSAFLIIKNAKFLETLRTQDISIFSLLIIFLGLVSSYFYTLLHKKLVLPVTKLSGAVLKIKPGNTVALRDYPSALNQELESLNTEFDDLQNRVNLDYKAMQLSKKLLSTCTETEARKMNSALAREISIFLNCKAVCLGLYQKGISRRGTDYSTFANEDTSLAKTLKRQMLQEIQLNTSIPTGIKKLPSSDSYSNGFQIHLNLDEQIGIGALIRLFEPSDSELIESGRLEEVLIQIVPSLIRKEINELQEEQQVGSELQKRLQSADVSDNSIDYAQVYMPARGLAGDTLLAWQDYDTNCLFVAIGDAAGKGVGPSLYAATCLSLLRPMAEETKHPNLILKSLNRTLCEYQASHMFLTLFLARVDLKTFDIQYASAGHNQMLLCKNEGQFEELSARGIPLGIMSEFDYELGKTRINPGERMFLYTDGVTEAEDLYQELYGKERLLTILTEYSKSNSEETLNAIKSSLGEYTRGLESNDDITMISLRRES
tara:strand:- start:6145 stop:8958 length:2814 start_codon:yes stop_codon:yes gene_type:complete